MPFASGLLESFESGGEAMGLCGGFGGGFGEVAGELGALADVVEFVRLGGDRLSWRRMRHTICGPGW